MHRIPLFAVFATALFAQNAAKPASKPPAALDEALRARITEFFQINRYHASLLPYFLERLKTTMDGDTPLLDKTMIVYGSPMADGNIHNHRRCPLLVLGGAGGQLTGNTHLRAPDGTPMANAMLSLMHKLGMDDLKSFGDSTGEFFFS